MDSTGRSQVSEQEIPSDGVLQRRVLTTTFGDSPVSAQQGYGWLVPRPSAHSPGMRSSNKWEEADLSREDYGPGNVLIFEVSFCFWRSTVEWRFKRCKSYRSAGCRAN
jgi:hypothetical protein